MLKTRMSSSYCLCLLMFALGMQVGCSKARLALDQAAFKALGSTVFGEAPEIMLKNVHLDRQGLSGRTVVLKGTAQEIDEALTYFVLADQDARLVVQLHKIPISRTNLPFHRGDHLSVLAAIDRTDEGMPRAIGLAIRVEVSP